MDFPFLELSITKNWGYQDETLKLGSQQYRAWSDSTDMQAGLTLYWWQRLITSGSSRVRVNNEIINKITNKTFAMKKY